MTRVSLTLYGRPECHLCDEAEREIRREAGELGIALEVVDIEQDDGLLLGYLERIPVVEHEGEVWFEFEVDAVRLRELVADAVSMRGNEPRDGND